MLIATVSLVACSALGDPNPLGTEDGPLFGPAGPGDPAGPGGPAGPGAPTGPGDALCTLPLPPEGCQDTPPPIPFPVPDN